MCWGYLGAFRCIFILIIKGLILKESDLEKRLSVQKGSFIFLCHWLFCLDCCPQATHSSAASFAAWSKFSDSRKKSYFSAQLCTLLGARSWCGWVLSNSFHEIEISGKREYFNESISDCCFLVAFCGPPHCSHSCFVFLLSEVSLQVYWTSFV